VTDFITTDDVPAASQVSEDLLEAMVAGANAQASRVAPCLGWDGTDEDEPEPSDSQLAEVKLVLIGAVQRWVQAGSGALQSEQVGPFGQTIDTRQRTGFNLWPSEIAQLQAICLTGDTATGAYEIDTMPASAGVYGVDYWWSGPDSISTVW
jgi:hypothetical protein